MSVLIIEDDDAIAEALAALLQDEGCVAAHVPDGRAALARLRGGGEKTCLILLDMSMPVMNGWQFREEQLKDAALAQIPVVVCTADGRAAEKARSVGAAGWLRKPIDPQRLFELVRAHCSCAPPAG